MMDKTVAGCVLAAVKVRVRAGVSVMRVIVTGCGIARVRIRARASVIRVSVTGCDLAAVRITARTRARVSVTRMTVVGSGLARVVVIVIVAELLLTHKTPRHDTADPRQC